MYVHLPVCVCGDCSVCVYVRTYVMCVCVCTAYFIPVCGVDN